MKLSYTQYIDCDDLSFKDISLREKRQLTDSSIKTHNWVAIAGLVVSAASAVYSNYQKKRAAERAGNVQEAAAYAGIEEQQREFDKIQELLKPYVESGHLSIAEQGNLLGINGLKAQQAAIQGIQQGPQFKALTQQGENAILQNASATGGLRGGNTQAALAQFRPNLLSNLIQQRLQNLSGLTSIGENAAARVGNAGMTTGANISNLYGQIGASQAGAALARGQANAGYGNIVGNLAGLFAGRYGNQPTSTTQTNTPQQNYFGDGYVPPGGSFGDNASSGNTGYNTEPGAEGTGFGYL